MASFTFTSVADRFPVGTSVGAYLPNTLPGASSPVSGAAITTATVASDGTLTFTGLSDNTAYVAYDGTSARAFRTAPLAANNRTVTTVAYAATVTPAVPASGDAVVNVGALTGNITIANPTGNPVDGQSMRFRFQQDATGSRTITWGNQYVFGTDVTTAMIPTAASSKWVMGFAYDATSSTWRCLAIARGF